MLFSAAWALGGLFLQRERAYPSLVGASAWLRLEESPSREGTGWAMAPGVEWEDRGPDQGAEIRPEGGMRRRGKHRGRRERVGCCSCPGPVVLGRGYPFAKETSWLVSVAVPFRGLFLVFRWVILGRD